MAGESTSRWVQLAAGAGSGLICDGTMHPMDTLRTRLMVERNTVKPRYRGLFNCLGVTVREEGVLALYKGLGITLSLSVPAHALYFGSYEILKRILSPNQKMRDKGPLTHFAAGIGADIVGSLLWVPMDVLKQRMMIQVKGKAVRYHSYRDAVGQIYGQFGIRGFYRGFWPAIGTFGPAAGIYFMTFEKLRRMYSKATGKPIEDVEHLPWGVNLACGFLGGSVAAASTAPIDMVKTRIMVQDAGELGAYRGFTNAIGRIIREEGLRPFYAGMSARVAWMAPGYALTIASCGCVGQLFLVIVVADQLLKKHMNNKEKEIDY